jgi:hypothetical protein
VVGGGGVLAIRVIFPSTRFAARVTTTLTTMPRMAPR